MLRVAFGVAPGFALPCLTFCHFVYARCALIQTGSQATPRGPAKILETKRLRPDHF